MNRKTIVILAACVLALVGSFLLRGQASRQNCDNVITLRDAMANIITLADKQTPPGAQADKFYSEAQAELKGVTC